MCKLNPLTSPKVKTRQEAFKKRQEESKNRGKIPVTDERLTMHFSEWERLECGHAFCLDCCIFFLVRLSKEDQKGCLIQVF